MSTKDRETTEIHENAASVTKTSKYGNVLVVLGPYLKVTEIIWTGEEVQC